MCRSRETHVYQLRSLPLKVPITSKLTNNPSLPSSLTKQRIYILALSLQESYWIPRTPTAELSQPTTS